MVMRLRQTFPVNLSSKIFFVKSRQCSADVCWNGEKRKHDFWVTLICFFCSMNKLIWLIWWPTTNYNIKTTDRWLCCSARKLVSAFIQNGHCFWLISLLNEHSWSRWFFRWHIMAEQVHPLMATPLTISVSIQTTTAGYLLADYTSHSGHEVHNKTQDKPRALFAWDRPV